MALLFSFSVAMDKFVIGKVVTAIDYQSIQFSIRLTVATAWTTRLISFSMPVLSWQRSITRMPPLHASAQ
jgi:putative Mn2+ efflux pump MntP